LILKTINRKDLVVGKVGRLEMNIGDLLTLARRGIWDCIFYNAFDIV
jgi:hypothetical protein